MAELETERRVLLAQLNLQATGSKAGLSGVWAVGLAIPANMSKYLYLYPPYRRTV